VGLQSPTRSVLGSSLKLRCSLAENLLLSTHRAIPPDPHWQGGCGLSLKKTSAHAVEQKDPGGRLIFNRAPALRAAAPRLSFYKKDLKDPGGFGLFSRSPCGGVFYSSFLKCPRRELSAHAHTLIMKLLII
jgi:hypothetical protein